MGAIQYLPVREYVAWSPRASGMGWEHATSYSMPIEELLNTIVPQFSGMFDNYWGRNTIHLHSEYPGVGHSFMNRLEVPSLFGPAVNLLGFGYDHASTEDAWQRILAFFGEHLHEQ